MRRCTKGPYTGIVLHVDKRKTYLGMWKSTARRAELNTISTDLYPSVPWFSCHMQQLNTRINWGRYHTENFLLMDGCLNDSNLGALEYIFGRVETREKERYSVKLFAVVSYQCFRSSSHERLSRAKVPAMMLKSVVTLLFLVK